MIIRITYSIMEETKKTDEEVDLNIPVKPVPPVPSEPVVSDIEPVEGKPIPETPTENTSAV
ncbi:MAG: hypothetical protein AAB782_01155 [Patescibacteria group bacterium]